VSNYNLTNILTNYAGVTYVDGRIIDVSHMISSSMSDLSTYIHLQIDSACGIVDDISTYAHVTLYDYVDDVSNQMHSITDVISTTKIYTYAQIDQLSKTNSLVGGMIYPLLYDSTAALFSISYPFIIYLRALDRRILDACAIGCQATTKPGGFDKWRVEYDFPNRKITYMKDEFNNRANFDFKNHINKI